MESASSRRWHPAPSQREPTPIILNGCGAQLELGWSRGGSGPVRGAPRQVRKRDVEARIDPSPAGRLLGCPLDRPEWGRRRCATSRDALRAALKGPRPPSGGGSPDGYYPLPRRPGGFPGRSRSGDGRMGETAGPKRNSWVGDGFRCNRERKEESPLPIHQTAGTAALAGRPRSTHRTEGRPSGRRPNSWPLWSSWGTTRGLVAGGSHGDQGEQSYGGLRLYLASL